MSVFMEHSDANWYRSVSTLYRTFIPHMRNFIENIFFVLACSIVFIYINTNRNTYFPSPLYLNITYFTGPWNQIGLDYSIQDFNSVQFSGCYRHLGGT